MVEIRLLREDLEKLDRLNLAELNLKTFTKLPVMDYAFFPGGNGLHMGIQATQFPVGGTILLGSNFGCSENFVNNERKLVAIDERGCGTWVPLLKLLRKIPIDPNECFYTNAWPFLHLPLEIEPGHNAEKQREKKGNLSGMIEKWLRNEPLMQACAEHFRFSFTVVKPRLIVALGTGPSAFLSYVWPKDIGLWKEHTWKHIDEQHVASVEYNGHKAVCVAITHPSMSNSNWRHRKPEFRGFLAEVKLLSEAAQIAGITRN